MINVNNVVLVGRITKDPEVRKTTNNVSVLRFTLACTRRFTNAQNENTDFISVVVWRQGADFLGQYAHKGDIISVQGSIQTGSYVSQSTGQKVYTTEVLADSVQLLSRSGVINNNSTSSSEERPSYANVGNDYVYGTDPYASSSFNESDEELSLDISTDDLGF